MPSLCVGWTCQCKKVFSGPQAGYQIKITILQQTYKLTQTMNKPKSNKAWRIGWPIIALGWLVLSVLEFTDDEGRIFRGIIFLVFAILWAVIYFNELKKFKKEE